MLMRTSSGPGVGTGIFLWVTAGWEVLVGGWVGRC